jgi:hypothetical protein
MNGISLPEFLLYSEMTPAQKAAFDVRQGIRQSDRERADGVQHVSVMSKQMSANAKSGFMDCAGTYYPSMESVRKYMPKGRTFEPAADPLAVKRKFADALDDPEFRMQMQGLKDMTAAINGESSSPVVFSNDPESVLNRKMLNYIELKSIDQEQLEALGVKDAAEEIQAACHNVPSAPSG